LISLGTIPETIFEGGTGSFSAWYEQPLELPDRFESGTLNVPGIFGVSAGVDYVALKGTNAIYNYELELLKYIYEKLSNLQGVVLYTPKPQFNEYVPTLSFNIDGLSSDETATLLAKDNIAVRAGLHCAPMAHRRLGTVDSGTVRICCSAFNTKLDADALVESVKKIIFSKKS
jgi:selenocysteine lyase/cysteine desulfurase